MLNFIAQLLHTSDMDYDSYFPAPQIFWDRLVQLGSSQLVLPAIYSSLKRKKLQHQVPKELWSYLQEISELNYKRNTEILNQIAFISDIFDKNKIDHVFLKGAALLITKPYNSIYERMIGDIDILVSENDLHKSQQLLITKGFEEVSNNFFFSEGILFENYQRHLKRIVHPNYIAAVEIHKHLLHNRTFLLDSKEVLKNKVKSCEGYFIPSKQHLWKHAILNWQYNDKGMLLNSLSFRTVTDVLHLESKEILNKLKFKPKAIKHFYTLLSLFYDNYSTYYPLKKILFKLQFQSKMYYRLQLFFKKIITFFSLIFLRFALFFKSRTYRNRVMNNPKLFLKLLKGYFIK